MRTQSILVLCTLIGLQFAACAPSLGLRMSVPGLPDQQLVLGEQVPLGSAGKVRVVPFSDGRPSSTIAVIDSREISSEGVLGAVVQEGFERYLRDVGVRVVLLQAPTIEGEIVEWKSKVKPKFPSSEATAVARVQVRVRDPQTQFVSYRGTFSGEASATHPYLTEEDIQKLLTEAMAGALVAATKDDKFMAQLNVSSIR